MSLLEIGFWVSVAFAILKLFGWLAISWWWVAVPLFISLLIVFGILVIYFIFGLIVAVLSKK